jgi:hypothetical protein
VGSVVQEEATESASDLEEVLDTIPIDSPTQVHSSNLKLLAVFEIPVKSP